MDAEGRIAGLRQRFFFRFGFALNAASTLVAPLTWTRQTSALPEQAPFQPTKR